MSCLKPSLFLLALIAIVTAHAQTNSFNGAWSGRLGQMDKPWLFDLELVFNVQGNIITGTSKIMAHDGSNTSALLSIKGSVKGNKLSFTDISIQKENNTNGYVHWCKKVYSGDITYTEDSIIISGKWENDGRKGFHNMKIENDLSCFPGDFRVSRSNGNTRVEQTDTLPLKVVLLNASSNQPASDTIFRDRTRNLKERIQVVSDSLKLFFYDNGQIDDDTITVYYNKQLLLDKQRISGKAIILKVHIQPNSENEIIMFADNEGSIPPNTAVVVFTDNGVKHKIKIDSNKKQNGTVILWRR